jgi:hypothetical protein
LNCPAAAGVCAWHNNTVAGYQLAVIGFQLPVSSPDTSTLKMLRRRLFFVFIVAIATTGCVGHDAAAREGISSDSVFIAGIVPTMRVDRSSRRADSTGLQRTLELQRNNNVPIRGLYLNRFAVQSASKMRRLLAIADSTEINAFVVDVKDEFGLNFLSSDPMLRKNAGCRAVQRDER